MAELDEYTKDQAIEFANNEAERYGFDTKSPRWKAAFKHYCSFAKTTMSIGRNPRRYNPREDANWPEVFGDSGFASIVAENFKGRAGEKPTKREIVERIKSAVSALVYLYMNGVYNIKTTTTTSESGKIRSADMSDLQLRGSDDSMSKDEADAQNMDVVFNQLALTIVETAAYEFLLPFFTMPASDVQAILDKITPNGKPSARDMAKYRTETEARLKRAVGDKLKNLSFKNLVLGSQK